VLLHYATDQPDSTLAVRRVALKVFCGAAVRILADSQESANEDHLTRLPNRRIGEAQLADRCSVRRAGRFSLVIADVDDLKLINDRSYMAGDAALYELAMLLADVAHDKGGMAYRWGGDEFCLILPVEREQADDTVTTVQDVGVRFSFGSASFPDEADSESELWSVAERRLKAQKGDRKAGREFQARP
jgi:diguanylate cyclase (GGDEF)-like protein